MNFQFIQRKKKHGLKKKKDKTKHCIKKREKKGNISQEKKENTIKLDFLTHPRGRNELHTMGRWVDVPTYEGIEMGRLPKSIEMGRCTDGNNCFS